MLFRVECGIPEGSSRSTNYIVHLHTTEKVVPLKSREIRPFPEPLLSISLSCKRATDSPLAQSGTPFATEPAPKNREERNRVGARTLNMLSRNSSLNLAALVLGSVLKLGKKNEIQNFQLNTGALMPAIAMGFAAATGNGAETPEEIKARLRKCLEIGYRHIDTAAMYRTEPHLGEVLNEVLTSGVYKREDLFITTKLHPEETHPNEVIPALKRSLSALQLEYVDMFLIHQPLYLKKGTGLSYTEEAFLPLDLIGVWRSMEKCVELGLTKAIGVANFGTKQLTLITSDPKIKTVPAVNQIEMHPGCLQPKLMETCRIMGTVVTAYSPLGAPGQKLGSNTVLDSPIIQEIAAKHNRTVAQIALRWSLVYGAAVVCKTTNSLRMVQNLDIFGWTLDKEDLDKIKAMPRFRVTDITPWCNSTTSPYRSPADLLEDWYGPDQEHSETSANK